MRATSTNWRAAVSVLCIVLVLGLSVELAWHYGTLSPNCHICKLCHLAVVQFKAPAVVEPSPLTETAIASFEAKPVTRLALSQSAPRSPPAL